VEHGACQGDDSASETRYRRKVGRDHLDGTGTLTQHLVLTHGWFSRRPVIPRAVCVRFRLQEAIEQLRRVEPGGSRASWLPRRPQIYLGASELRRGLAVVTGLGHPPIAHLEALARPPSKP
jgi:hypothetical protein